MVLTQQICRVVAIRRYSTFRNSTTLQPIRSIPPIVWRTNGTTRNARTTPQRRSSHAYTFNTLMGAPHIPHNRRVIYFSSSAAMSEDEMQRRIEVYKDLYVVARDCMEDLVSSQVVDDENENDDDDEFLKDVAFLQDAVLAAQKEYHNLINDLNENTEQQDRFVRSHGIKLKRLEMELAMLQLNTNVDDDDDNDNIDNYDDDDDDDDDEDHDRRGK